MIALFCTGEPLQRCLTGFARDVQGAQDPILHVLLAVVNCPVQIQLTRAGLQMFQGVDLTLPYHRMTQEQRTFLLDIMSLEGGWAHHENSMLWRRQGTRKTLPTIDVLEAMCVQVLAAGRTHPDPRARVAVCNILLQRAQASIPLSHAVQAELNARLFPQAET